MTEANELPNADKEALGSRLRKLREGISWTLGELSEVTKHLDPSGDGVSKVSISRYENGDSFPGYREIKLLAQAFAVPVASLFYGDVPDPYSGWDMSLDDYLRNVIRSVLIEEGVIEGESRADREHKQMLLLRSIQLRRKAISRDALDDEDKAERTRLDKAQQGELDRLALEADALPEKKSKKQK
ncbi:helix-turn-helix domain-containing protein [Alicycliphilus sp. T452]